jgi:hypothetical protein
MMITGALRAADSRFKAKPAQNRGLQKGRSGRKSGGALRRAANTNRSGSEHFQAKWMPVRVKKMLSLKN